MAPPQAGGHLWADEVEEEDEARGVAPPETFRQPPEWRASRGDAPRGAVLNAFALSNGVMQAQKQVPGAPVHRVVRTWRLQMAEPCSVVYGRQGMWAATRQGTQYLRRHFELMHASSARLPCKVRRITIGV
jgi:hypothetical protein